MSELVMVQRSYSDVIIPSGLDISDSSPTLCGYQSNI